jgi:HSP20 family protein
MNELRVNDLFAVDPMEDVFRGMLRPWRLAAAERAPRINIDLNETASDYQLKADVPGVRKEDISVHIDGNQVTISADVKRESNDQPIGSKALRSERYFGQCTRSFLLDSPIDEGRAEAKYENGLLQLTLPPAALCTRHPCDTATNKRATTQTSTPPPLPPAPTCCLRHTH